MDRRTLLRAVIVGAGAGVIPHSDNNGVLDIEVEAARTAELKAAYGLGKPEALYDLEQHAYTLRSAVRAARSDRDRTAVGRLFADAAQHLAHIHYKGAGYAQGAWWAEQAQDIAEKVRDRAMITVALCRKSIIRAAEGEGNHAARLAETAQRFHAGPWAEALANIHRAYGYATNPEYVGASMKALDDAEAAITKGMAEGTPRPIQTVDLTIGWQDYHRGNILVRHKPKQAESLLVKVLGGLPETMRLSRGSIQIRRAEARHATGDYEQAVTLAKEGLAIATEGGATRDVLRVMRLRNSLGKVAPAHILKGLDDALEPHREVRGSVPWRWEHG